MSKREIIYNQLTALAFQESTAFCYSCYIKAPSGCCDNCGSNDLMRVMDGVGCEWGTEWVIEEILKEYLKSVNEEEAFESMIEDCYPTETKVGWLELNTVDILKTMDKIAWDIAKDEYISYLEEDEEVISFDNGSNYYWTSDIEELLENNLQKSAS